MKISKMINQNEGFAVIGIMVAFVVLAVAGYFAFTTDVSAPIRPEPNATAQSTPFLNGYTINPDAITPTQSFSPTPVPQGPGGAYGRVISSYTIGPTASTSPYVGEMIVKVRGTNVEYIRFKTDAQGNYRVTLPSSTYYFIPADGTWPWATDPRYTPDVIVKGGTFIKADLTLIVNTAQ